MVSSGSELCLIKKIYRVLGEGFLYVTFDIIEERVIEVKKFGACAGGSKQGQPFQLGTRN